MTNTTNTLSQLTEAQVASFHEKGWIGPLDAFSGEEVAVVKEQLEANSRLQLKGEQKYRLFYNSYLGVETVYNHHFWCEPLCNLFTDKRVVNYLNQLGEENLLFWRTAALHRMPQQSGLDWHQAINYYGSDLSDTNAELVLPEGEKVLNLTVWMALKDTTQEMSSISFANGSHRERFKAIKVPSAQGAWEENVFRVDQGQKIDYSKNYDFNEDEWKIESFPIVKAGQIVIFCENVMHKASANMTSQERWIVNGRYIRPSVKIHPQRLIDNYQYEFGWDLKKHFCILVSGSNDYKFNRVLT